MKIENFKDYTELALRTESTKLPLTEEVITRGLSNRLFHAILGISTEINEVYDAIEDKAYYEYDMINILEEFGDMAWYLAIACDERNLDIDYKDVYLSDNINKAQLFEISNIRKLNAEILDHSKKVMFYGKQLDDELVDTKLVEIAKLVFISILAVDGYITNVLHTNINKLKVRYPDTFTDFHAENRDLDIERNTLEESINK